MTDNKDEIIARQRRVIQRQNRMLEQMNETIDTLQHALQRNQEMARDLFVELQHADELPETETA